MCPSRGVGVAFAYGGEVIRIWDIVMFQRDPAFRGVESGKSNHRVTKTRRSQRNVATEEQTKLQARQFQVGEHLRQTGKSAPG